MGKIELYRQKEGRGLIPLPTSPQQLKNICSGPGLWQEPVTPSTFALAVSWSLGHPAPSSQPEQQTGGRTASICTGTTSWDAALQAELLPPSTKTPPGKHGRIILCSAS